VQRFPSQKCDRRGRGRMVALVDDLERQQPRGIAVGAAAGSEGNDGEAERGGPRGGDGPDQRGVIGVVAARVKQRRFKCTQLAGRSSTAPPPPPAGPTRGKGRPCPGRGTPSEWIEEAAAPGLGEPGGEECGRLLQSPGKGATRAAAPSSDGRTERAGSPTRRYIWMGRCEPPAGIMRTSGFKSMSRSTTSGVDVRHSRTRSAAARSRTRWRSSSCPAGGPSWEKSTAIAGQGRAAVVATGGAHERVSERDVQELPDALLLMKQEWWVVDHHTKACRISRSVPSATSSKQQSMSSLPWDP
jgi:hypothetical protein